MAAALQTDQALTPGNSATAQQARANASRALPQAGGLHEGTAAAPGEAQAAELLDQHISAQACVAAVAIGKRVDGDQPVMETDRDLIHRLHLVLHLVGDVAQQGWHLQADLAPVGTDAFVTAAVLTRPTPALAEHLPVQAPQPGFLQRTWAPLAIQPEQGRFNVALLPFVELAAADQMGGHQPLQLIDIKGCRPGRKAIVQSHSRAPLVSRIS